MKRIIQLSVLSILFTSCSGNLGFDIFPPLINVDSLVKTDFVATLDEKIKPGQNQIYCSTLPYVWFEIREGLQSEITTNSKAIHQLLEANDYQNSLCIFKA